MQNLLQNELEQSAKMRLIKNNKNISKEELLIALLKSAFMQNFAGVKIVTQKQKRIKQF